MVGVKPFALDQWVQKNRSVAKIKLNDSCVAPLSLRQLRSLSGDPGSSVFDETTELSYGTIRGSVRLRDTIAQNYSQYKGADFTAENILVTQGTISANFLVLDTLCGPGDHVICQVPTYQQLYEVPARAGAEVSLWKMREDRGWMPDIAELEALVKPNTKMIIISTPNNPTGVLLPQSVLRQVVDIAKPRGIIVLSDEVYYPMVHSLTTSSAEYPHPLVTMGYEKVISTSSVSKAYALPGIRLGWIATRDKQILDALSSARDYTTISVSQLDDQIAAFALSNPARDKILARSLELCAQNTKVIDSLVEKHKGSCSWIKPTGGGTAFLTICQDGKAVDDKEFAEKFLAETGVMMVPAGHCFGFSEENELEGYFRIGLGIESEILRGGMSRLDEHLTRLGL